MISRRAVETGAGRRVTDGRVTGTLTGQYDRDYDGRSWRWFAYVDYTVTDLEVDGTETVKDLRSGVWLGEARFV